MRFYRKTFDVEAFQWTGEAEPAWLLEMMEGASVLVQRDAGAGNYLHVTGENGYFNVRHGDWLVRMPDGRLEIVPDAMFREQYGKLREGERTYDREDLIDLCSCALVEQSKWENRDSAAAQSQVGQLWALLLAGCEYEVTEADAIRLQVKTRGFQSFENGSDSADDVEFFYLPTDAKLQEVAGGDWY